MTEYDLDMLGLDKDIENQELLECDWKLISKLKMEFRLIEQLFGPVPKKYKKYFKSIYALSKEERKQKIKKAKVALRKRGMKFLSLEELL